MKKLLSISLLGCLFMLGSCAPDDDDGWNSGNQYDKVYGTGSIYGTVVDANNAEPIRGAQVQLLTGEYSTLVTSSVTYDDGHFEFHDIDLYSPTGQQYSVKLTQTGYYDVASNIFVTKGHTSQIDLTMKPHQLNVTTAKATVYDNNSVKLNGSLSTTMRDLKLNAAGFFLSSQPNPKETGNKISASPAYSWSATINPGLGTFYYQAYIETGLGTFYGSEVSFTVADWFEVDNLAVQKVDVNIGADWQTANSVCRNSRVGGYSDWRLPTSAELDAIEPYLNSGDYWSSTPDRYGSHYFYSNYHRQVTAAGNDNIECRVRAVRSIN